MPVSEVSRAEPGLSVVSFHDVSELAAFPPSRLTRPDAGLAQILDAASAVINGAWRAGDSAPHPYARQFGPAALDRASLTISERDFAAAFAKAPADGLRAANLAIDAVRRFQKAQKPIAAPPGRDQRMDAGRPVTTRLACGAETVPDYRAVLAPGSCSGRAAKHSLARRITPGVPAEQRESIVLVNGPAIGPQAALEHITDPDAGPMPWSARWRRASPRSGMQLMHCRGFVGHGGGALSLAASCSPGVVVASSRRLCSAASKMAAKDGWLLIFR